MFSATSTTVFSTAMSYNPTTTTMFSTAMSSTTTMFSTTMQYNTSAAPAPDPRNNCYRSGGQGRSSPIKQQNTGTGVARHRRHNLCGLWLPNSVSSPLHGNRDTSETRGSNIRHRGVRRGTSFQQQDSGAGLWVSVHGLVVCDITLSCALCQDNTTKTRRRRFTHRA